MFKTWQQQFGLFRDDSGIWRCGGRLSNAHLPFATKQPVFLDSHHHLTTLITIDAHDRVQHNGVGETLNELRAKYWIIRGRSFVRRVLHGCVVCRSFKGRAHYPQPTRIPSPGSLSFCIYWCGLCRPLRPLTTRRKQRCGYVFSPVAVRAIHLEVVPDLTAQSFIQCFKLQGEVFQPQ